MHRKHREAVFQYWRSLILRETRDPTSLEQIAARALSDPEVQADPEARRMIEAEIEERRQEFRPARIVVPGDMPTRDAPPAAPPVAADASPRNIGPDIERLRQSLHAHIDRKEEAEGRSALARLRRWREDRPDLVSEAELNLYESALDKLSKRLRHVADQVTWLTEQAIDASRRGDETAVAQLSRRLASIHTTYPRLLDDHKLEAIRDAVMEASEEHEHQLAVQKLVQRERAVAQEIRQLADAVHRFHHIARTEPHDSEVFRKAEREYRRAARDVRAHDLEWLAAFTMELADLLAEWDHPLSDAETKVDHFLHSVRVVLARTRAEVEEIDHELEEGSAGDGPSTA